MVVCQKRKLNPSWTFCQTMSVSGKERNIKMTRIIIELEGGLVTEVYCSDPDADVSVIDRDALIDCDDELEEEELDWIVKAEQEIQEKNLTAVYS